MHKETVILLETAIDHLTGEELGLALTALNEHPQILDAIFLPGIGKKNRPAGLLQVLCTPVNEEDAVLEVFRHTHSLGVRRQEIQRYILDRSPSTMQIAGRTIPAKQHLLCGRVYSRPESDAVASLAKELSEGAPGLRFMP